jgi:hypothetical protein
MTTATATAERAPADAGPDTMDSHTLDLLGFDKVRELLAGYAASSLGRDLARQI